MQIWQFRYYVPDDGESDVKKAYDVGDKQLRARFLSRAKMLASLPIEEWNENLFKNLSGTCSGLSEIRFKANNIQQRPIGFVSGKNEFTILFWATEKGNKWVPLSACEIAQKRKAEVLKARSLTHALWIALE